MRALILRGGLVAAAIATCACLAACAGKGLSLGGGADAGNTSLGTSLGVLTADYLILDVASGGFTTATAIPDLATNADYRGARMVFRRLPAMNGPIGAGTVPGGGFGAAGQGDETAATASTGAMFIGVFEVTQGQWSALSGQSPWNTPDVRAVTGDAIGEGFPAFMISRESATAALAGYRARRGIALALPSDAQWELACRGGSTGDFAWGDGRGIALDVDPNAVVFETLAGQVGPSRVGAKAANAFGLHDMHGNVWELTADGLGQARGGSWNDTLPQARCANRLAIDPAITHPLVGLRLVIVP